MKKNYLIFAILVVLFPGLLSSCSKSDDLNQEILNLPQKETQFNAGEFDEHFDIRTLDDIVTLKSANSVPLTEIDTSQFAIHIKDHYGDVMCFNELGLYNAPSNYRGYTGVFVNNNVVYKASAIYNISTKEFSASLPYKYDIVFHYQCSWKSTNYFEGAFCYMMEYSTSNYPNRLRLIKCSVVKGSFPGMND